MTRGQKIICAKVGLLELSKPLSHQRTLGSYAG